MYMGSGEHTCGWWPNECVDCLSFVKITGSFRPILKPFHFSQTSTTTTTVQLVALVWFADRALLVACCVVIVEC